MAHDERHSPPPRGDNISPHHDDIRSRHELDEDRHRRGHYDHHDDRRGPPGPPVPGNGVNAGSGAGPDDRGAPTDRAGPDDNGRRDDRDDLDNRRYRGHDDHNPHNDRHHDYPEDNHHDRDRRDALDRHGDTRPDDRQSGPPGAPDLRPDGRDHDDRHVRSDHDRPNNSLDNGETVARHSPPPAHDHNPQDPDSAGPPPGHGDHDLDDGSLINLFVRNVAKHVQEHQLIELFSKYGKVDSAVVVRDPHSRECRGFGFVKMTSDKEAQVAIDNLREFEFEGRHISVERAKRDGPHSRTPGAYMGLDRRIRDRYAGIKRSREYAYTYVGGPYAPPPPSHYPPYRPPRYHEGPRPRHEYRSMHPPPPPPEYHRPPMNQRYEQRGPGDERERQRRRYDLDGGPRYSPRGEPPRDQRVEGRDPPVPREPADELN